MSCEVKLLLKYTVIHSLHWSVGYTPILLRTHTTNLLQCCIVLCIYTTTTWYHLQTHYALTFSRIEICFYECYIILKSEKYDVRPHSHRIRGAYARSLSPEPPPPYLGKKDTPPILVTIGSYKNHPFSGLSRELFPRQRPQIPPFPRKWEHACGPLCIRVRWMYV